MLDNNIYQELISQMADRRVLSFADYLQTALYHPKYGYYMKEGAFGAEGDFITAPMISPMLGHAIAHWLMAEGCHEVLEIAPGNGLLAQQVLKENPEIKTYYLYDINPLPSQKFIGKSDARIVWLDKIPEHFSGAVVANEWLDALPFRRYCWHRTKGVQEIVLQNNRGEIQLTLDKSNVSEAASTVQQFSALWPSPYMFESGFQYYEALSFLATSTGPVLLLDYGYEEKEYYHPDRHMGSMICFNKHQVVDFTLEMTGQVDITSAVNWTEVIKTAKGYGYHVDKYGPQADFLNFYASGYPIDTHAAKLMSPHEMGQYVKALALSSASKL